MITVEHYKRLTWVNKKEKQVQPFKFKQLWATDLPSLEIGSEKHGDLAITFNDDGSIELKYWSPEISSEAVGVVPATIVIK